MFTGLVQDIGVIRSVSKGKGDTRFVIETGLDLSLIPMGASICCSGACMTVVSKNENSFAIDVSNESISKTTIGAWDVSARINLEPSLKLGDEMGGHIVSGHVDCVAEILSIDDDDGSKRIKIKIPRDFSQFIAYKGSVTIDGISLTVNDVEDDVFGVNIIPHTWEATTLCDRAIGEHVNIEIDMLARYVARILESKSDAK